VLARTVPLILLLGVTASAAQSLCEGPFTWGQCSKPDSAQSNKQAEADKRGTEQQPIIVQTVRSREEKAKNEHAAKEEDAKARREFHLVVGTYGIAVFTALLMAGTIGLTIFTFRLWRTTKQIADEAKTASDAALKASTDVTNLAAITARRELRAYLGIDAGAATVRGSNIEFWVNVRNRGQTPAYDVSRIAIADIRDPGDPNFSLPSPGGGRWVIVPGAFWTPRSFLRLDEVEAAGFDDSQETFFWGRIEYTDTFGDAHWMTFRYGLGVRMANERGEFVGWELDVTEEGNGADRESHAAK
jgi:hypothetical protein